MFESDIQFMQLIKSHLVFKNINLSGLFFYDDFNEYNFEPIAQIQEQEQEDVNS